MQNLLRTAVDHPAFNRIVNTIIILSGIQLGAETFPEAQAVYGHLFDELNLLVIGLYLIELAMRIGAHGKKPWNFFKNGWNVFDFLVITLPLIPFAGHFGIFARVIRVFRLIKILREIPELGLLVSSLTQSVRYILSISLLLGMFFYGYSIAGVLMFSENDALHFRDLGTSMLTMFRVVTLEDWTDIMYINMYGCASYSYEFKQNLCTKSMGHPIEAALFFVSFVTLGTMIILNLFIAVIVESITAQKNARGEKPGQGANTSDDTQIKLEQLEKELVRLAELSSTLKTDLSKEKKAG